MSCGADLKTELSPLLAILDDICVTECPCSYNRRNNSTYLIKLGLLGGLSELL